MPEGDLHHRSLDKRLDRDQTRGRNARRDCGCGKYFHPFYDVPGLWVTRLIHLWIMQCVGSRTLQVRDPVGIAYGQVGRPFHRMVFEERVCHPRGLAVGPGGSFSNSGRCPGNKE